MYDVSATAAVGDRRTVVQPADAGGPPAVPYPAAARDPRAATISWPTIWMPKPICSIPMPSARRRSAWMDVAMANSALVALLNQTKASLLTRLKGDRGSVAPAAPCTTILSRRISTNAPALPTFSTTRSAAIPPQRHFVPLPAFAEHAGACRQLAQSILLRQKYQHNPRFEPAFSRIQGGIGCASPKPGAIPSRQGAGASVENLHAIDAQLANIESEQTLASGQAEENSWPMTA